MAIKGLIFDFDGLILDTETPEYDVWQEIFQSYGTNLPLSEWEAALGASFAAFDPIVYLTGKLGIALDHSAMHADHRKRSLERIYQQPPQPGILETLKKAQKLGLNLGVASSSPVYWVHPLLKRLDLFEYFDQIICKDHVQKIKPDPELFLRCCAELGITRQEAIIFEDSPNGIRAANAAEIYCVAVPNILTRRLDTSHADLHLTRIDEIPLEELLCKVEQRLTSN
jgi:HAD superfamily hydrolase (TIGR01509 family)